MEESYIIPKLTPNTAHRTEEIIRRSRFITNLFHANSQEAARTCISQIRTSMPDATHHCTAFVAGPAGHTALIGYNDDGEPHGTAGRPMLTVLLHSGIGEIVAIVTRYFGGVKLGTGGLVRAYQQAVNLALETLPTTRRIEMHSLCIRFHYSHVSAFLRILESLEGTVLIEKFEADVCYHISLPKMHTELLHHALRDLSSGKVSIVPCEQLP